MPHRILSVLLILALVTACAEQPPEEAPSEEAPPAEAPAPEAGLPVEAPLGVTFDSAAARVVTDAGTLPITVELADTEAQRSFGLMERETLAEDHGMLFRYDVDQPASAGFWMYRTWIPLDIAFLDAAGQIVAIRQMDACRSTNPDACRLDTYAPGVPYRSALEMGRGWFERHGVVVGDRVELEEGGGVEAGG